MQGKVFTGELIPIFVDLHIERIICLGIIIQKENDIFIIDLGIKFGFATFQGSNEVLQTRLVGRCNGFRCHFNGGD